MSESDDIRTGLRRRGVEPARLAEACGISGDNLEQALSSETVDDGIRAAYAALEVESLTRKTYMAVFGRPVRNDRIQVVKFDGGGRDGMVRKKPSFKPRFGLACEVTEASDEDGWYCLVGKYRDNGVRLD